ncbi:MAG: electron transport complex subunit RsxC [Muribaculaceae bacterium]|nr:electron transport complex subunit RsxC [Muribaculaceae bacterium]
MSKTFKIGGIHPNDSKLTAGKEIVWLEQPQKVQMMLYQQIGAPSICIVKVGDKLKKGQLIAEDGSFVSACQHAPISGTVTKIEKIRNTQGWYGEAVTIEADPDRGNDFMEASNPRTQEQVDALSVKEIIDIVDSHGVVGLGGATFPTRVKLLPPEGSKPEVVIINGVECEPYLTCDDALMRRYPNEIVKGVELLMKVVNVSRGIIAIEDNKPEAIKIMRKAVEGRDDIKVVSLKKKYPQGGEKQLIAAVLGKEVRSGALPVTTGAVVNNVATVYTIFEAVYNDRPLIERVVTVTGPTLTNPGNFLATLGTPIRTLIEAAGGLPEDTGKVIAGGPMMGKAVVNIDAPTTKGLSGILVLPESESHRKKELPCIRCANCVNVCPMGLEPFLISLLAKKHNWEDCEKGYVMNCIECGSCSYICPSHRPLLDYIKLGKQTVAGIIRERNNKK